MTNEKEQCDVVVVGLGAMGSAVIDQLAMKGLNVIGLDRFTPPHDQGSSHGETRITRQAVGEGANYVPFVLASQRRWRELEQEMGEKLFEQCGTVVIASDQIGIVHGKEDFMQETVSTAKKFGIDYSLLDRNELVSKFPQFSGATNTDTAYYEPGGGYVFPERCIDAQLKHAVLNGARIYTGVVVKDIQENDSGVQIITDKMTVEARKAVVSAGAWIPSLLGDEYRRLLAVCRQTLHWFRLDPDAAYPTNSPVEIWIHGTKDTDSFYGFPPLPGQRMVKVATEQATTSTHPDVLDREVSARESQKMFDDHIKNRLIGVSDNVVQSAACMYTITPDNDFILDYHPKMPNVFVVSACSGHGFKHSAGIGQAVSKEIIGESSEFDLRPFSFRRFFKPKHNL